MKHNLTQFQNHQEELDAIAIIDELLQVYVIPDENVLTGDAKDFRKALKDLIQDWHRVAMRQELTDDEIVTLAQEADDYADKDLGCKGEFHPDWSEVRDVFFVKLVISKLQK